jgi:purine-binding chemotaxis protein CheW
MTTDQWVVFTLEGADYALSLEHIVEVIHIIAIAPAPEAPPWLAGVINLRGRVLPVMDLRARLGLPSRGPDLSARILVTSGWGHWLGLIVDSVTEVLTWPAEPVELPATAPGFAVVRANHRLITVLDIERLIAEVDRIGLPLAEPP